MPKGKTVGPTDMSRVAGSHKEYGSRSLGCQDYETYSYIKSCAREHVRIAVSHKYYLVSSAGDGGAPKSG